MTVCVRAEENKPTEHMHKEREKENENENETLGVGADGEENESEGESGGEKLGESFVLVEKTGNVSK